MSYSELIHTETEEEEKRKRVFHSFQTSHSRGVMLHIFIPNFFCLSVQYIHVCQTYSVGLTTACAELNLKLQMF